MSKRFFLLVILLLMSIPGFCQSADTAWVRRYNGPGNGWDDASAIAVDRFGNVYVTGTSFDSGTGYDYATVKYNHSGNCLWVRRYNGPTNGYDLAEAIAVDGSGNVYITGYSDGGETDYDYATIKYDSLGNQLWVKRYNGLGNYWDEARAVAVDGSGNVYVTGKSYMGFPQYDYDYLTIRYDQAGNERWVRRYNGPTNDRDRAYAVAVDGSGNVYVTGGSDDSLTSSDYATIKYDSLGNQLWVKRYNGPANDYEWAQAIAVDGSGNVYVTGSSARSPYPNLNFDYATIKYDPNGYEFWIQRYNCYHDYASAIAVDYSGNVYVTGSTDCNPPPDSGENYNTVKYDKVGNEIWVRRYNGPGAFADDACAIAIDSFGDVYVTGYSYGGETDYDYATIKYDSLGNQLWVERYNGPGDSTDYAVAIAVDGSGNVYVTGYSYGGETDYDYATIKYIQEQTFAEREKDQNFICSFVLYQNYPNPFNPETIIEFSLRSPTSVTLKIYNVKGELIRTLLNTYQTSGIHQVVWDGKDDKGYHVSSGVYFYQLRIGDHCLTKKLVRIK